MANGPKAGFGGNVGNSTFPVSALGAHNFARQYYRHHGASGDVRALYADLDFTSTGSGETLRIRGIANGTLCATGGTINALHATGRVASGKTVSGALNAIRATLEVAGTNPTPGGTLSALQLDSNIEPGATLAGVDAFVRVSDSGTTKLGKLLNIPAPSNSTIFATHTTETMTHSIRITDAAGTPYYIMCASAATNRGGAS